MFKRFTLLVLLAGLVGFTSCETDFSLNGPYEKIPIVFGLLDQGESIQYIKITRTFLGDGDNNDFAQIADSSYFNQVDAQVSEFDEDGEATGRYWQLHDTIIPNKESGTFYGPEQKVYVFYADDLNELYTYKLKADLDEGAYQIDAKTNLIQGFRYASNVENGTLKFTFGTANSTTNNTYNAFISDFTKANHAAVYSFRLHFNFKETYTDGSTSTKTIVWKQSDLTQDSKNIIRMEGKDFYVFLQDNIAINADVTKREFIDIDLKTVIAHTELAKYMDIAKPSSSLVQSKPQYTNINSTTSALGLFSSRYTALVTGIPISSGSMEELCTGKYTGALKFCSTMPTHIAANESFVCN